jgi:hypothetical protein
MLSTSPEIEAREATSELCTPEWMLCDEGWTSGLGNYVRFDSEGDAEYWLTVLGDDGRRNGAIVLDMSEVDLTPAERRLAVDILFTNRDWS